MFFPPAAFVRAIMEIRWMRKISSAKIGSGHKIQELLTGTLLKLKFVIVSEFPSEWQL